MHQNIGLNLAAVFGTKNRSICKAVLNPIEFTFESILLRSKTRLLLVKIKLEQLYIKNK